MPSLHRLIVLLGGAGLAAAAPAGSRPLFFDAPWMGYDTTVYPEGHLSCASRLADFNGDGVLDLAVSSWYANSKLTILFGCGDGQFEPPVYYDLLLGGLDLEVADFDNDGDTDIVVSGTGQFFEGDFVSLFRNQGDGTFLDAGIFAAGPGPAGITAADFNADGFVDVAVAHDAYIVYGNSIAVILNDGAGGFQPPQVVTLQSGTRKIDAADVNGDLLPDLVVAHETNKVTILLNEEGWFFGPGAVMPGIAAGSIIENPAVTLADGDLDGDVDIFYSHSSCGGYGSGAVALYRNQGNDFFAGAVAVSLLPGADGAVDLEVTDVTGDGWPDVLGAIEISGAWALVPGTGEGDFLDPREYRATQGPVAVNTGDLDGDGDAEVVIVGRDSTEAAVYMNPGDGGFVQPPVIEMVDPALAPVSYSNLVAGDIDHDDDLDLIVGYSANFLGQYGLSVRRNQGDGTFAPAEDYLAFVFPKCVRLVDVNGDGHDDLLWLEDDFTPRLRWRLNQGDGGFGNQNNGPQYLCQPYVVKTFDLDNDGDADAVLGGCYGDIGIALNTGGVFAPIQYHAVNGNTEAIGGGDFNEDGIIDLLSNSGIQGYPEISLGNGDGTFQPPFQFVTGRDVHDIAVADLDDDGWLDFAVNFNLDGKGLGVRRGRGDGNFFLGEEYHGSYNWYDNWSSMALGDADGDGVLDAMCAAFGAQDVAFWRGLGDGTFEELQRYGVGQPAADLAFGDFNGDGVGDLAVLTGPASPFTGWYYPGVVLLPGLGAEPGPTGDLDGDGVVGILDFLQLLAAWGPCPDPPADCPEDLDGDGVVGILDFLLLLANWG